MMFRSYSNTSEYFVRDYVAIAMTILRHVDIMFTHESSPGISLVFI